MDEINMKLKEKKSITLKYFVVLDKECSYEPFTDCTSAGNSDGLE